VIAWRPTTTFKAKRIVPSVIDEFKAMDACGQNKFGYPQLDIIEAAASTESSAKPPMWRSLEELAGEQRLLTLARREFPSLLDRLIDAPSRREFLRLMGASLALAGFEGCIRQPEEKIVPYVRAPEEIIPGKALYYATAFTHAGASVGLLAESQMGRPVKIEGNPLHPAVPEIMANSNDATKRPLRFGATDTFAQAVVLSLYDPDRSQTVLRAGQIDTWEAFYTQLREHLEREAATGGEGLRVLSETVISPTLADQIKTLLNKFPQAKWHQYEPIANDAVLVGARLAFGADAFPSYDFAKADVILSLDADFLVDGPQRLVDARAFAERRKVGDAHAAAMNRLYMVETSRTQTGAVADHRLAIGPREVLQFASAIAEALGLQITASRSSKIVGVSPKWIEAVVEDLRRTRGRSLVLAGCTQPPIVHALAHWLNQTVGNVGTTVSYREPIAARAELQSESLRELTEQIRSGDVSTLIVLEGNPAYNAPADSKFGEVLAGVPFTVHLSEYVDETSAQCSWHIPAAHLLESWSDTRAADGTASLVQPLIAPLYNGKTSHQLLAALLGDPDAKSHDLVRSYWERRHQRTGASDSFETFWRTSLHDGIVAGTSLPPITPTLRSDIVSALEHEQDAINAPTGPLLQIAFRPDPSVWDGRFANNGWLQELPRPFSKLTWNNAALVSPATAAEYQLESGEVVEIATSGGSLQLPVAVIPVKP
jgi:MoCo/4Fe-4S cofactor protein with predicted Tat translocation signal